MRLLEVKSRLSLISFIWSCSVGKQTRFLSGLVIGQPFVPCDWSEGCINLAALACPVSLLLSQQLV